MPFRSKNSEKISGRESYFWSIGGVHATSPIFTSPMYRYSDISLVRRKTLTNVGLVKYRTSENWTSGMTPIGGGGAPENPPSLWEKIENLYIKKENNYKNNVKIIKHLRF